jgi:hypothetical protein
MKQAQESGINKASAGTISLRDEINLMILFHKIILARKKKILETSKKPQHKPEEE